MKKYKLTTGDCKECCLEFNCKAQKQAVRHFLESHGIMCGNGLIVEVVAK